MSLKSLVGSMAVAMVRARSCAEMPVAMPSRASIETVKAVRFRASFWRAMYSRRSWSARWRVSDRQIRPRPCLAMKLMASGVAICAGMTRSPSFSRSSASTRMIMRPLRKSSMISSIGERKPLPSAVCGRLQAVLHDRQLHGARDVAGEHVDLQVDPVARLFGAQVVWVKVWGMILMPKRFCSTSLTVSEMPSSATEPLEAM